MTEQSVSAALTNTESYQMATGAFRRWSAVWRRYISTRSPGAVRLVTW